MIMFLAGVVAASLSASTPAADPALAQMVALYDSVCLKAFPDDAAVDALMASKESTVLTPQQVSIYLHDDPGRGWWIDDANGQFVVTIEAPPYHACAVRRKMPAAFTDLSPYQTVVEAYRAKNAGFIAMDAMEMDVGPQHSRASGWGRQLPGGGSETLLMFENTPTSGEHWVEVRFVHDLAVPAQ